jgi:hypothetical protein
MSATTFTLNWPLTTGFPPTPPNTEVTRSIPNSGISTPTSATPSRAPSECGSTSYNGASIPINSSADALAFRRGLYRNIAHVGLASMLGNVQEEHPGQFNENDTDVPNNTPCDTEEAPSSPREGLVREVDLPAVDDLLLDGLNGRSAFSSPTPSVFGGTQSKLFPLFAR